MKYNIFQGNQLLLNQVAKSLGYENPENSWFTEDIYLSTYFYLSKRFGPPAIYDDYKLAGTWDFKVKNYTIRIELNSNWVIFIVFGPPKYRNYAARSCPYWVKRRRLERLKEAELIDLFAQENTDEESQKIEDVFRKFCLDEGIDNSWTDERFQKEKLHDWIKFIDQYNNQVIGLDYDSFTAKHGSLYINSGIRHALRTLDSFLKNMLTPIWIRDVPYNIKGRCDPKLDIYTDNIPIDYLAPEPDSKEGQTTEAFTQQIQYQGK